MPPMTRAKATSLLNQREMALYDDSRANALRQLDEKALHARIVRARTARDRARDLVQRQTLSSREQTGSKRGISGVANQRSADKAALLADILLRFENRLPDVQATAGAEAAPAAAKPARKVQKSGRAGRVAPLAGASVVKPNRTRSRA